MSYIQDNYGSVNQQLQGALIPTSANNNTGNLIHRLPTMGGKRRRSRGRRGKTRGGDMGAFVAPATLLAMQQLYRRKGSKRKSKKSRTKRFKSRRYR